jgi:hypothetical protein
VSTLDSILAQKRLLYPTGRAWHMPEGSDLLRLHRGLGYSEAQMYDDSASIMDSLLPDNDRFTSDDATDWERRLGLVTNLATPLATRMAAIRRKMAAPGPQPAHGYYLYIQSQLQAAGFNVWVHENLFPLYPTGQEPVDPSTLYGTANLVSNRHGMFRHGQRQHGLFWNNRVINSIYQEVDDAFDMGGTYACTFFIGGQTLGTYASVQASREQEFRQLILSLKQTQLIALLYVNYI